MGHGKHLVRLVRVYMQAHDAGAAGHDDGIAQRLDFLAYAGRRQVLAGDHALGAIAELRFLARIVRPCGACRRSGHAGKLARLGAAPGPDELLDAAQQVRQTGAAGIDHARAPEHFELFRGFLHRVVGRFPGGRQEGGELALGRNVKRADANRAHHAQDGSLAGIAQAVAGGFRRRLQPQRDVAGIQARLVLPGVGQSLQELRQDHAGIPPCAV